MAKTENSSKNANESEIERDFDFR